MDIKAEYEDYRNKAIEATLGTNIKVSHGASVHVLEDGAFVEAVVWVPKKVCTCTCKSSCACGANG